MKSAVLLSLLSLVATSVHAQELDYNEIPSAPLVVEQLALKSRDFGDQPQRQVRSGSGANAAAATRDCPRECIKEECVSPSECEAGNYVQGAMAQSVKSLYRTGLEPRSWNIATTSSLAPLPD